MDTEDRSARVSPTGSIKLSATESKEFRSVPFLWARAAPAYGGALTLYTPAGLVLIKIKIANPIRR